MERQDVFDEACRYLLRPNGERCVAEKISENGEVQDMVCVYYRPEDGNRCVVGHFLKDEDAEQLTNFFGTYGQLKRERTDMVLRAFGEDTAHAHFLGDLQPVHDKEDHWQSRETMYYALRDFATQKGLSIRVLEEVVNGDPSGVSASG